MKAGYTTTEFWLTLIGQAVSLLVMTGVIPSGDVDGINSAASKIVAGAFAAWTLGHYIKGRSQVKHGAALTNGK